MNDFEKQITVKSVTAVKQNKNGGDFISVCDESKEWWYVDSKKLFGVFTKGATLNCRVNRDNKFSRIVDVMSDDAGIQPRYFEQPAKKNEQLDRIESKIEDLFVELDEVKKMINPL